MKNILVALFLICLFSSCARLLNGDNASIRVHARPGTSVTFRNADGVTETVQPVDEKGVKFEVERSKKTLDIKLKNDSVDRVLHVKRTVSEMYYANFWSPYGLGFLFDLNSKRRFSYPHHIYPDFSPESRNGYRRMKPLTTPKTEVIFTPGLTNFVMITAPNMQPQYSPLGVSVAVNRRYNDHSFWSYEIGYAGAPMFSRNNEVGRYVPGGRTRESLHAFYGCVRHHSGIDRFDVGYGAFLGRRIGYETFLSNTPYKTDSVDFYFRDFSIGGAFAANYRFTNKLCLGINYQPQLLAINSRDVSFSFTYLLMAGLYFRFDGQ